MSLREEIGETLDELYSLDTDTINYYDVKGEYLNDIISIFEKRIDEMYVKHPNLAGVAHNECLDEIRKMLK